MASAGADLLRPVLRPLARVALLGVLASALSGLAACGDPCLELAHKLCECEDTEIGRETCIRNADAAYQQTDATELTQSADQCAALVDTCDCSDLDSEAGKQACGLSR